jgi:hypothetical protein
MEGSRRICLQCISFKEDKDDESHSCPLVLPQKLTEKISQEVCYRSASSEVSSGRSQASAMEESITQSIRTSDPFLSTHESRLFQVLAHEFHEKKLKPLSSSPLSPLSKE